MKSAWHIQYVHDSKTCVIFINIFQTSQVKQTECVFVLCSVHYNWKLLSLIIINTSLRSSISLSSSSLEVTLSDGSVDLIVHSQETTVFINTQIEPWLILKTIVTTLLSFNIGTPTFPAVPLPLVPTLLNPWFKFHLMSFLSISCIIYMLVCFNLQSFTPDTNK